MSDKFYKLLIESIRSEQKHNRSVEIDPIVWQEFCSNVSVKTETKKTSTQQVKPGINVPSQNQKASFSQQSRSLEPNKNPQPKSTQSLAQQQHQAPPEAKLREEMKMPWDELRNMALNCQRCQLDKTRKNVVFGEGNEQAELMFIGEGPGGVEDATGRPFVGKAGQLLDNMITAMKYKREETYIGNVVKCRPPGNRAPTADEAATCIGYLYRQIELIKPKVIVLLGGVALNFLLKETVGITKARGIWHSFNGIPVMPTFHPAYLLRNESAKREAWHDLQLVMKALGKL